MNLYGPQQLAESVRTVRRNTILVAEDIPEKDYDYRPTPESRSVAETLIHIAEVSRSAHFIHAEGLSSLDSSDFRNLFLKSQTEEKIPRSKKAIIALLEEEGTRWCDWVEGLSETILSEQVTMPGGISKSRFEMLLGTKEHEMHHRAQLMVVERMLGIVPHLTRRLQAPRETAAS